jgi:hypothetical protein
MGNGLCAVLITPAVFGRAPTAFVCASGAAAAHVAVCFFLICGLGHTIGRVEHRQSANHLQVVKLACALIVGERVCV